MEKNERKQSVRVQTSILNGVEKKVLVWLAERMPRWVTSDMLTALGTIGAIIVALGCLLSNLDIKWMWLTCFGFFVNWFGDSLDGSLARVRKTQRPLYGFFLDHNVDGINEVFMICGFGLSPFVHLVSVMAVMILYLLLSMYVYINAHLKNEFKLTYSGLGPTEFRIIAVILCIVMMYVPFMTEFSYHMDFLHNSFDATALDFAAWIILLILMVLYVSSLIRDGIEYARLDPLPKYEDDAK